MTQKKRRDAGDSALFVPEFDPVRLRYRRDRCTPERQVDYIKALSPTTTAPMEGDSPPRT